jgi:hypothetical protein
MAAEHFGICTSSNCGEESQKGFTVKWGYDPASQVLEIQCVDKPFVVPCKLINLRIEKLVNDCRPPSASLGDST